jgi:hypothetical protein
VLDRKGGICLFKQQIREVSVKLKTRGGVSVIYEYLRGGECNLPLIYLSTHLSLDYFNFIKGN